MKLCNQSWRLALIAFVALWTACSPSKEITLSSTPGEAKVYQNNQEIGSTPYQTKLKFKGSVDPRFTLKKEGFLDTTVVITHKPKDKVNYAINLKKKETVEIELVTYEPLQTNKGVKLQRTVKRSVAYLEIIERSPNVKSVTKVTANEDPKTQIGEPVLSPAGDAMVYSMFLEEGNVSFSNLWKQPIGGIGRTRITFGNNIDLYPTFTDDGKYIFFSSNRINPNPTIWRVSANGGGGLTSITNTSAEDFGVSLFPGNELMAYTSLPNGAYEPQIWTVSPSGTLPTQLREGSFPHVSPNGEKILFTRTDRSVEYEGSGGTFNPVQLWMMGTDGSGETQMTQNLDYSCIQPKWSPDGKYVVFASNQGKDSRGNNNYDIWMMRADGTGKTQLTTNGSWDDSPCWSADGKRVYFRSNRGGVWNIWYFEPMLN